MTLKRSVWISGVGGGIVGAEESKFASGGGEGGGDSRKLCREGCIGSDKTANGGAI